MNDNPRRKRRILRSVQIDEVSGVDRPAQEGAGAILRKSNTMNDNPEDVICDALAVRDDGQEPKYAANDYEQAILHEARLENSATETFAQVLARVASNGNDHVDALVFASQRVRDREAAMGKSAPAAPSPVALDAERVRKSGSSPRYTRDDYHGAMQEIAKAEARPGEGVAGAFARLVSEGRFDDLYAAAELAEEHERAEAMSKAAPEDRFYPMLMDLALMRKRQGETIEQAASRLLHEDATVRDAYAAVNGL